MDGAVGDPVEFRAGTFQHGYAASRRQSERLTDSVVGVDAAGDVEGRGRDVGTQGLDDRVAPGDDLGARLAAATAVGGPAVARTSRTRRSAARGAGPPTRGGPTTGGGAGGIPAAGTGAPGAPGTGAPETGTLPRVGRALAALVGDVLLAVGGLGGRALTFKAATALASRAHGGPLAALADRPAALGVAGHVSPSVGERTGRRAPRRGAGPATIAGRTGCLRWRSLRW